VHSGHGGAVSLVTVDRIRLVGYAEDTVQWITDSAEETDSQSDSSDSRPTFTFRLLRFPFP